MIPKIIHQVWIGQKEKPNYLNGWKKLNPTFKYILWTEEEINKLKLENRKTYEIYYKAKKYSGAVNVLRIELLFKFGGVYIDADMEAKLPIKDLINTNFFASYSPNLPDRVANGVIGSEKNHPLLKKYIEEIGKLKKIYPSYQTTGSKLLTKLVKEFKLQNNILPIESFHPVDIYGNVKAKGKTYGISKWGTTKGLYK